LTQYISDSQKESSTGAISFLLRLTFQQPGRAYAMTDVLSDTEQDVVRDLTHLGLLYTFEHKKRWYYVPTLLSSGLSGGFSGDDGDTKTVAAEGHVIVETNYRVYAYTSSLVEMEILRLFTRADYRLPNLYVGMLTRESVQNALRAGVDAEQIVAYLRAHAHKQVRAKKPSVPGTVSDQIRLWARDMHRVDAEECVLYCDFPMSGGFYDAVVAEAVKRDALVWRDDASRRLAVKAAAHEAMKPAVAVLKQTLGDSAI
jgi:transcription initiation factor TFIIH subunit 4